MFFFLHGIFYGAAGVVKHFGWLGALDFIGRLKKSGRIDIQIDKKLQTGNEGW